MPLSSGFSFRFWTRAPALKKCAFPDGTCISYSGEFKDHWAITVNGNWRLTFTFEGEDAVLVDYQDYH
jgi:plasmid maintenance system killer protein